MKTRNQFLDAGQELYGELSGPNYMRGTDKEGNEADFYLMGELVKVQGTEPTADRQTIGIGEFVACLATGIAMSNGEELDTHSSLEIDVLEFAILIPLRREITGYRLDEAVRQYDNSHVPTSDLLPSYVKPAVEHLKAEAAARHAESGFERLYGLLVNSQVGTSGVTG